jgi:preprotein translocase SecE subunit
LSVRVRPPLPIIALINALIDHCAPGRGRHEMEIMATAKAQRAGLPFRFWRWVLNIGRFLKDVQSELQRVVWPSHEETYSFTVVVILAVAIVAAWVAVLDLIMVQIMTLLHLAG